MLKNNSTRILGLELFHYGSHRYSCRLCELERKGNEIQITARKIIEGSLAQVLIEIPRDIPVALTLTGKGIIYKNVAANSENSDLQVFRSAFPSVAANDFFIQQHTEGTIAFLTVARKELVSELIEKLKRAGLEIYSLSFSGIVALLVFPQLNFYGDELQFDGHHFKLTSKQLSFYNYEVGLQAAFPVKIGEEPLAEELIVAYATAFQILLADKIFAIKAGVPCIDELFEAHQQASIWKGRALNFLFGLFISLCVSFALFSHYNRQNDKLLQSVGAQAASTSQVALLKKDIAEQEKLLKHLRWNGGYSYSFIINEIGRSVPRQLTLTSFSTERLSTQIKNEDALKPNLIIKGITANLPAANNWIYVLREQTWIKDVKLLKFEGQPNSEDYQFEVIIFY